jgi:4-hydroxy 2-oxovalerate aldolase
MTTGMPVVLDCTLRDGGNQNNWGFSQEQANRIVAELDAGGIDVIEVGYRGGSGSRRDPRSGLCADSGASFLAALPDRARARLAVMVVPSVCGLDEVDDLARLGVDVLRVAAYPWDAHLTEPFIRRAKETGMTVSLNLMAVSYVSPEELRRMAGELPEQPDVFYLADSFGALRSNEIARRVETLSRHASFEIGVHVHNNLGLAAANTLAALDAGATWADASLCGMARGAGNLATEQLAALLHTQPEQRTRADLHKVCAAATYVESEILPNPMRIGPDEIAAGVNNHHYYFQPLIREESSRFGLDPLEVGRELGLTRPRSVRLEHVTTVCEGIRARQAGHEEGAQP